MLATIVVHLDRRETAVWAALQARPKWQVWLAGFVAFALAVVGGAAIWRSRQASTDGSSAVVQPNQVASLSIPGVNVSAPAGAVTSPTEMHLRPNDEALNRYTSPEFTAVTKPVGQSFSLDLSGSQPKKKLMVRIAVPDGMPVQNLVLFTVHDGRPGSIVGTYDAATRTYTAAVDKLSLFWLGSIDPRAVYDNVVNYLRNLLSVANDNQQPECFTKPAKLPDGSTISVKNLGTPELLWPCVEPGPGNKATLTMHSGSGAFWRVRTDGGTYKGAAEVEMADAVKQALYTQLVTDKKFAEGLLLPVGKGSWLIDLDSLPAALEAKVSEGMWFADALLFAVTMTASVLANGKAFDLQELAKKFAGMNDLVDCLGKAAKAIPDTTKVTTENFASLTKVTMSCKDLVFEQLFGPIKGSVVGVIVGIIVAGASVLGGAMEAIIRNTMQIFGHEDALHQRWRIEREGSEFASVVGVWEGPDGRMVIKPDGTGTIDLQPNDKCLEPGRSPEPGSGPNLCKGAHATFRVDSVTKSSVFVNIQTSDNALLIETLRLRLEGITLTIDTNIPGVSVYTGSGDGSEIFFCNTAKLSPNSGCL